MGRYRRRVTAVALVGTLTGTLGAAPAIAAAPVEAAFGYTGSEQEFVVPTGVTSLHIVLVAGNGGLGAGQQSLPGFGHRLEGDLAVTPGTTLYLEVGGNGGTGGGGFNGGGAGGNGLNPGGGGGGATDIRTSPRANANSLGSRLAVAGGGGGGGSPQGGGKGGDAGSAGLAGSNNGGGGGGGATLTGGGTGGVGLSVGVAGSLGQGGGGAFAVNSVPAGGGGGGGYFGGGGGASSLAGTGGGGGGGSSFAGANVSNVAVSVDTSNSSGITLSYIDPAGGSSSGVVSAQVTITSAPCLELSTTAIDFGTLAFGADDQPATPAIDVTSCSTASETILASGTDATGINSSWQLTDSSATCSDTLGTDAYHLSVGAASPATPVSLGTTNKTIQTLSAGAVAQYTAFIDTACPGSTGAGVTMSMQINLLATE